jgi:SAM-dependent methyltransferase
MLERKAEIHRKQPHDQRNRMFGNWWRPKRHAAKSARTLPPARGWVDEFSRHDDQIALRGWILHPAIRFNRITATVNGVEIGGTPLIASPNVLTTFPVIPHADVCYFNLQQTCLLAESDTYEIHVTGHGDAGAQGSMTWHTSKPATAPLPPPHLRMRVAGGEDPRVFAQGFQSAMDLLSAARPFCRLESLRDVLDWGCGCGRVSIHLVTQLPDANIFGCDIDEEATTWAQTSLTGDFRASPPYPPLPYRGESFDLVLGSSVMTHLARDLQTQWIDDIRRILRPGGLAVLSTHGSFAATFLGLREQVDRLGIIDAILDNALDGIAPEGYYRGAFQTRDFTEKHWQRGFQMLSYIEAGLMCYQDLAILRKVG